MTHWELMLLQDLLQHVFPAARHHWMSWHAGRGISCQVQLDRDPGWARARWEWVCQ
jgi:hypothetical protein